MLFYKCLLSFYDKWLINFFKNSLWLLQWHMTYNYLVSKLFIWLFFIKSFIMAYSTKASIMLHKLCFAPQYIKSQMLSCQKLDFIVLIRKQVSQFLIVPDIENIFGKVLKWQKSTMLWVCSSVLNSNFN